MGYSDVSIQYLSIIHFGREYKFARTRWLSKDMSSPHDLDCGPARTNVSNSTSTCDGEQLHQILLKSIHIQKVMDRHMNAHTSNYHHDNYCFAHCKRASQKTPLEWIDCLVLNYFSYIKTAISPILCFSGISFTSILISELYSYQGTGFFL